MRISESTRLALLDRMNAFSRSRSYPDLIIGDNYLIRHHVIPHNPFLNVFLHAMYHDDDDRALHSHPWPSVSITLEGPYDEITADRVVRRHPGDIVFRGPRTFHRLAMVRPRRGYVYPCTTLFITGPVMNHWGFACPKGFVPHELYIDERDGGQIGRGCGEMS